MTATMMPSQEIALASRATASKIQVLPKCAYTVRTHRWPLDNQAQCCVLDMPRLTSARIGIMFNFTPDTGFPGFRVRPEDPPSFAIDENGSTRRAFVGSSSYDTRNLTTPFWGNLLGPKSWIAPEFVLAAASSASNMMDANSRSKHEECVAKCLRMLPSPFGDLQSSEFRKCYRECMGGLG